MWLIGSLDIAGGFLGGTKVDFPNAPGLTCIIGPRGSGKSTLIEAIRYCVGGTSGATKSRQEMIQANLGTALVSVRTVPDNSGSGYVISRRHRQPAVVATGDGRPLANIDLERGTFLPIDVYSSLEIEAIADESFGEKRRALLDELQGSEYRSLLFSLTEHQRALEASASAIRNARQKVVDLLERAEELGDARAKLAAMPLPLADDTANILTRASNARQDNEREAQMLHTALKHYEALECQLQQVLRTTLESLSQSWAPQPSMNEPLIQHAEEIVTKTAQSVRIQIESTLASIASDKIALAQVDADLGRAHAQQDAAYASLVARHAAVSKSIQDRLGAQRAVAQLEQLEAECEKGKSAVAKLLEERARLKGAYLLERERISAARDTIAKRLESEVGKRVRVRVLRNADDLAYKKALLDGLRGARVRNHEDILAALLQMRPEELAELVEQNDAKELDTQTSLGEERSRKILDAFRTNLDPFSLEVQEIEDRITIELNVGTDNEPNFKDASELSRGQKCTALLPLLLARRDTPLIIDQPEDNLDNHFIYETVVETIKRLKSRRQMVFVTHNANIPVLGEADLVIVMNSDGRSGFVHKMGSVDDCRGEIVDLLEGGREAFELRRRRYER